MLDGRVRRFTVKVSLAMSQAWIGEERVARPDEVVFCLNGEERRIPLPPPTRTLLEWLREDAGCVGVKEGCAEGDCGACTVLAHAEDGRLRPLNSCILFLPMADGLDLLTVEGLSRGEEGLHPVQAAMVDLHASQCGFCTPGFVMALAAWGADEAANGEEALCAALAGNLCRCTGYGPILEAGRRVKTGATQRNTASRAPNRSAALAYKRGDGAMFEAPDSLERLLSLMAAVPNATLVAGATDVGLWVTKQERDLPVLISTRAVPELRVIEETKTELMLGAAVTYAEAFDALARLHDALKPYLRRLGGPQVRESGTVGGNIANGSPIGDMPPVLIALGAEIELAAAGGARRMALEDFFIAYGKQDRRTGEVLTRIFIPRPAAGDVFAAEKLSKRPDQDISAVSMGLNVRLDGDRVISARVAYGGLAGTPKRAVYVENALIGQPWSMETVERAAAGLMQDFTPLTDHRASAAYRLQGAQGLLRRAFLRAAEYPDAPDLDRAQPVFV